MFKFEKETLETTRGIQATKYDELLPNFVNPGDTLFFEEGSDDGKLTRAAASQAAKRMISLDPQKRLFHSGYHTVKRRVFIRVRPTGEVPSKSEESQDQDEEAQGDLQV